MPTCRPAGTLGGGGGGQDGSSEQIWAYIYIMWCGVGVFVGRVPNTVLEPVRFDHVTSRDTMLIMELYLHFSKTSLDELLDVHLCSYFHEHHCVTRRDVIQT